MGFLSLCEIPHRAAKTSAADQLAVYYTAGQINTNNSLTIQIMSRPGKGGNQIHIIIIIH